MVLLDALVVGVLAAIFGYLYTQEKIFEYKYMFLLTALVLAIISVASDEELVTTSTVGAITTYTYALSNTLLGVATGLGGLLIAVIVIFVVKGVKSMFERGKVQ